MLVIDASVKWWFSSKDKCHDRLPTFNCVAPFHGLNNGSTQREELRLFLSSTCRVVWWNFTGINRSKGALASPTNWFWKISVETYNVVYCSIFTVNGDTIGVDPHRISFFLHPNYIAKSDPFIFIDTPWDIVTRELLEKESKRISKLSKCKFMALGSVDIFSFN